MFGLYLEENNGIAEIICYQMGDVNCRLRVCINKDLLKAGTSNNWGCGIIFVIDVSCCMVYPGCSLRRPPPRQIFEMRKIEGRTRER